MPNPDPNLSRGQWRVWLKTTAQSSLLDRLPPSYDPGVGGPRETRAYARELLAELADPDSSPRPLDQTLTDVRRFRLWVEGRRNVSRRIILSENGAADRAAEWPGGRPPAPARDARREPTRAAPRPVNPRANPMWDDWLDG